MFSFFKHIFVFGLVTGLCVTTGRGQSAPDAPPPTFRLLSTLGSHSDLKYQPSKRSEPVNVSLNQSLSRSYPRPANGVLSLFRELPPPPGSPPDTPPVRQIVFGVRLPKIGNECVVVTTPRDGNPSSPFLDAHVIDDSSDYHGPGQLMVLNLSTHNVAVLIDKNQHVFPAGKNAMIRFPAKLGRVLFRVAANDGSDAWKFAYKGERRLSPYHRGYLVLTDWLDDPDYTPEAFPPPVRIKLLFEFDPGAVRTFKEKDQNQP